MVEEAVRRICEKNDASVIFASGMMLISHLEGYTIASIPRVQEMVEERVGGIFANIYHRRGRSRFDK